MGVSDGENGGGRDALKRDGHWWQLYLAAFAGAVARHEPPEKAPYVAERYADRARWVLAPEEPVSIPVEEIPAAVNETITR